MQRARHAAAAAAGSRRVARLNEAGVPCGVLIAPILPGISDGERAAVRGRARLRRGRRGLDLEHRRCTCAPGCASCSCPGSRARGPTWSSATRRSTARAAGTSRASEQERVSARVRALVEQLRRLRAEPARIPPAGGRAAAPARAGRSARAVASRRLSRAYAARHAVAEPRDAVLRAGRRSRARACSTATAAACTTTAAASAASTPRAAGSPAGSSSAAGSAGPSCSPASSPSSSSSTRRRPSRPGTGRAHSAGAPTTSAWARSGASSIPARPGADAIDLQLHGERVAPGTRAQRHHEAALDELPDGAFVVRAGEPWLVLGKRAAALDARRLRRAPSRGRAARRRP